jgi:hypothetical protein
MPVSRDEFDDFADETLDLSEGTDARRVLSFLDQHAEQAYTRSELADETGIPDERLDSVLRRLREQNLVVHRDEYWAVDEHRVASLAGMSHGFAVAEDRYPPEDMSEWGEYAVEPRG